MGTQQEQALKQKKLFYFWVSLAVAVVAAVMLIVSAIVGTTQIPKGFVWGEMALLGVGVILCGGFGLSVLYQKLNDDEEEEDEPDETEAKPKSSQAKSTSRTSGTQTGKPQKSDTYRYMSITRGDRVKVFRSMSESVKTISDYYKISKKQACSAFVLAIVFCVAGLMLLLLPVTLGAMGLYSDSVAMTGIIAGVVSELFGGTALLVHKSTVSQFNRFYEALHDNEMLLSAISIAEHMSDEDKRDAMLEKIVDSTLICMTDTSAGSTAKAAAKTTDTAVAGAKPAETAGAGDAGEKSSQKA